MFKCAYIIVSKLFQEADEFAKIYNGYRSSLNNHNRKYRDVFTPSLTDVPDTVDWRTKGYVTEVKNQVSFHVVQLSQQHAISMAIIMFNNCHMS